MKRRVAKKIYKREVKAHGCVAVTVGDGSRLGLAMTIMDRYYSRGCPCPTAPRGHTIRHYKCEYHDHHCANCHKHGRCTSKECRE